jgi:hypothetical protein
MQVPSQQVPSALPVIGQYWPTFEGTLQSVARHWELMQALPAPHVVPQVPQLVLSCEGSTQVSPWGPQHRP